MLLTVSILFCLSGVVTDATSANEVDPQKQWPHWRGPSHNGIIDGGKIPHQWGPDKNIVWKVKMPSWSGATPAIWGDYIFLTSPSEVDPEALKKAEEDRKRQAEQRGRRGGRRRGGRNGRHPGGQDLVLHCLSKKNGESLWSRQLDQGNKLFMKGNNTSPSPVTDGNHVWVVVGTGHIAAFDFEGNQVWTRNLQEDYGPFGLNWGYASSPVLHEGLLIVQVLHGSHTDDPSYIVAFDAESGDEFWRVERPTDAPRESPDAYTTPLIVTHGDQTQIVISGGDVVTGHRPDDGEELWRVPGLNPRAAPNYRIVASPIVADGMVYAPTRVRPLTAITLGEEMRPDESSIAWQWQERGGPDVPTPLCDGEYFYMIDDSGMATCLDAKSGEKVWGPERTVSGTVSGSPLLIGDKIFFTNEECVTVVLQAGPEFKILETNELDGGYTIASPAISDDKIYLRAEKYLYCIGVTQDSP